MTRRSEHFVYEMLYGVEQGETPSRRRSIRNSLAAYSSGGGVKPAGQNMGSGRQIFSKAKRSSGTGNSDAGHVCLLFSEKGARACLCAGIYCRPYRRGVSCPNIVCTARHDRDAANGGCNRLIPSVLTRAGKEGIAWAFRCTHTFSVFAGPVWNFPFPSFFFALSPF